MGYIINENTALSTGTSLIPVEISGSGGPYTIPAGYAIRRIYATAGTGFYNLSCGNTNGAADLIDATVIYSGNSVAIDTTIIAIQNRVIYFNVDYIDDTLITYLKIYLDKIN